jgi:nucleoside-diphosphate-sugar epimerase
VEDLLNARLLASKAAGCDGIVHLAAISRVAWGEQAPELCHRTNVEGTKVALEATRRNDNSPWLLFSSSREVYGEPTHEQTREDEPFAPLNHYGRSKAHGEALVDAARAQGRQTAIVRLSNVYGGRRDHPDRAVPSLMSRALAGEDLIVTGGDNYFDFVHVEDCVAGLLRVIDQLQAGEAALPPINFATGVPTSLRRLAHMAAEIGGARSQILERQARSFDVSGYCGSPERARALLGWEATIDLPTGLKRVAEDFRLNGPLDAITMPDPDMVKNSDRRAS